MSAIVLAVVAAAGFTGAGLLALLGGELRAKGRSYSAAVAAGILLALSFADLFPEALELAEESGIAGFVVGFVFLFFAESAHAHAHRPPEEGVLKYALGPFVLGLAVHNLADGFILGVSSEAPSVASGLVGLGIVIHQVPVGISLAAGLVAARATRLRVIQATVLLGLAIPLAAALTLALPVPDDLTLGFLTGAAGGVLAYMGTSHLLPEAQAEHRGRSTGYLFALALIVITAGLLTILGD